MTATIIGSRVIQGYNDRHALEPLKRKNPNWWRMTSRERDETDDLGIFKYAVERSSLLMRYDEDTARMIVLEIAGPTAWEDWHQDGNVVAPQLFEWLWYGAVDGNNRESGIGDLIDMEYDLYLHHLGARNGKSNLGWLRNMLYSLTQQIVRTDLSYWLLYAALRPDRNCKLISYPYYVKYAREEDNTAFFHIDIHVPKYVESKKMLLLASNIKNLIFRGK